MPVFLSLSLSLWILLSLSQSLSFSFSSPSLSLSLYIYIYIYIYISLLSSLSLSLYIYIYIYIYTYIRGAYDTFPDFFRMGILNRRRLLKGQYVIAIHLMRWQTNFYDFRFIWTATSAIGIHPTKAWLSQLVNFKIAIRTWERYAIKFCFKLGKNATETFGMLQTAFRPSCMNRAWVFEWHKRFKESRASVRDDERCGRSKEVNTPELIGHRVRFRVTMFRF